MITIIGHLSCLKILKIGIDQLDYHQVTELLSHLSSLKFLELHNIKWPPPNNFLSLLCTSAESPWYLPQLQSLQFVCTYFPWKYLPQIFALPCWQSLRVRVSPELGLALSDDTEILKLLLELINKGFDFCIIKVVEICFRSTWIYRCFWGNSMIRWFLGLWCYV